MMAHEASELAAIEATLERILASAAFRNSRQCQRFLRHVVERTLAGDEASLHERILGCEVFERPAAYDTAADPVVRVRATEVRKRLAQYYGESAAAGDVRIELPAGSYRAEFGAGQRGETASAPPRGRKWIWVVAAVLVLTAAASWMVWRRTPAAAPGAIQQFWQPLLAGGKPVLVYCGQPVVYFLSGEVHRQYRPGKQRGSYALALPPGVVLRGADVIPVTDQFVGIGNAHTAALLAGWFAAQSRPLEIRYANDVSFSDLRTAPAVLVGAFSNAWTLELTAQARFVFEQDEGARRVQDRQLNRTWSLGQLAADGKTPEDYAVVTRLMTSASGQPLVAAAGITQYGTRAAGEFISSAAHLVAAFGGARADWPQRNVQVLLHTTVYRGTPAPPRVLAVHVW